MKLMVLFMHQLQLIGIKTNLESFVTTTLMEHMLNRHQLHLFLWVSKQWGNGSSSSFSKKDYATPKDIGTVTISTPISMSTLYQGFICASSTSGPSLFVGFVTAYSGNSLTVRLITSLDSGSGGSLVPNYILLGH